MSDIFLANPGLEADLENMDQAVNKMNNALDEFMKLYNANIQHFSGQTSDQLKPVVTDLMRNIGTMHTSFGTGRVTLADMQDLINAGDNKGAQVISG